MNAVSRPVEAARSASICSGSTAAGAHDLNTSDPELIGSALLALEEGDHPGACEACGWGWLHNGVCPECLVDTRLRYDLKPATHPDGRDVRRNRVVAWLGGIGFGLIQVALTVAGLVILMLPTPGKLPGWRVLPRALRQVWDAFVEAFREDWQAHKRMVAERKARDLAAKTVVLP
jgi:hypothetical protein